jgi:hypothetical protein
MNFCLSITDNRTQSDTRLVVRQNMGGNINAGGRDNWQNNSLQDDRNRNKGFINQQQGQYRGVLNYNLMS